MYDGYLAFGDTEVVNMERLMAYVAAGIVPAGVTVKDCTGTCDGLGEALGHGAYTSPILDEPPWYNADDPDTLDFAGVLPLEVTGLDGSTRTVEMVDLVTRGALPMRPRYNARTVAVSALLVGRTSGGVQAGLSWLTDVLNRVCDPGLSCQGLALTAFTACPTPVCDGMASDSPLEQHAVPYDALTWLPIRATVTDPDTVVTNPPPRLPLLAAPVYGPQQTFVADWTVTGPAGTTVMPGAVSPDGGTPLETGTAVAMTGSPVHVVWQPFPFTPGDGDFRPALFLPNGQTLDFSLTVSTRPPLSPEECVAPYKRTFPQVTTVAGPTVVGQEVTHCGDRLLHVEWTWVAGSPYRVGVPTTLAAGLTSTAQPTVEVSGVDANPLGAISATPYNCPTPPPVLDCAGDPCFPGFTAPPAPPVITDPSRPSITTQSVRAAEVRIDPSRIPTDDGVFTFTLANDGSDKVGIRVRVYDDVLANGLPPDLCNFAYEYLIDYIAPNAVFIIDGISGTGQVLCPGFPTPVDASRVMRGSYGGPVTDPVARCDARYYVIVQWLATYATSCPSSGGSVGATYRAGDPQGELQIAVAVAPREG